MREYRKGYSRAILTVVKRVLFLPIITMLLVTLAAASPSLLAKNANIKEFTYDTKPPLLDIYIDYGLDGEKLEYLGKSGNKMKVDLDRVKGRDRIKFVFKKAGFDDRIEEIPLEKFKNTVVFRKELKYILRVKFRTEPSGALVFRKDVISQEEVPLTKGKNEPVEIDVGSLDSQTGRLDLIYRIEPYYHYKDDPTLGTIRTGLDEKAATYYYPPPWEPPIKLKARHPFIDPLLYWVTTHTTAAISISVVSLALVSFLVFGIALPYHKRMQKIKEKNSLWEAIAARVDTADSMFGRLLGKYKLVEKIGEGGMATVYRALPADAVSEEGSVALKVIRKEKLEDEEFAGRFKREMKITAMLNHHHILRVLNYGDDEGYLYIVMELVKGKTFKDLIPGSGYPLDEFIKLFRPVLEAMAYAHNQGVVHRDLKPENIMLSEKERVVVMDFGIARGQQFPTITATGMAIGTPAYMSPEQAKQGSADPRTDQYSLGVMAYQMLTGRLPFFDENPINIILQHISEEPLPLKEVKPGIPEDVDQIVRKMLAKEMDKRFKNLREVGAALEKALKH